MRVSLAITLIGVLVAACSSSTDHAHGVATLEIAELEGSCPITIGADAATLPPFRHVRATGSVEGGGDYPDKPFFVAAWQDADGTVSRIYLESYTYFGLGFTQWKDGKRTFIARTAAPTPYPLTPGGVADTTDGMGYEGEDDKGQIVCRYVHGLKFLIREPRTDRYDPQWLTPVNDVLFGTKGPAYPKSYVDMNGTTITNDPKIEAPPGAALVEPSSAPADPGGLAPIPGGGTPGAECGSCQGGPNAVIVDQYGNETDTY